MRTRKTLQYSNRCLVLCFYCVTWRNFGREAGWLDKWFRFPGGEKTSDSQCDDTFPLKGVHCLFSPQLQGMWSFMVMYPTVLLSQQLHQWRRPGREKNGKTMCRKPGIIRSPILQGSNKAHVWQILRVSTWYRLVWFDNITPKTSPSSKQNDEIMNGGIAWRGFYFFWWNDKAGERERERAPKRSKELFGSQRFLVQSFACKIPKLSHFTANTEAQMIFFLFFFWGVTSHKSFFHRWGHCECSSSTSMDEERKIGQTLSTTFLRHRVTIPTTAFGHNLELFIFSFLSCGKGCKKRTQKIKVLGKQHRNSRGIQVVITLATLFSSFFLLFWCRSRTHEQSIQLLIENSHSNFQHFGFRGRNLLPLPASWPAFWNLWNW